MQYVKKLKRHSTLIKNVKDINYIGNSFQFILKC